VFEMAAPIQSPAKCEVRSVIRFLNAKGERPAEIHKNIVAVDGDVALLSITHLPPRTTTGQNLLRCPNLIISAKSDVPNYYS
jgi:hypothetical protein